MPRKDTEIDFPKPKNAPPVLEAKAKKRIPKEVEEHG